MKKKKIDRNDKIEYWQTRINEDINWLFLFDIMELTADRIYNERILLPSLLNIFSMFQIRCWYSQGEDDQNKVDNIAIRCSNREKETMISMDNINTTYQYIITSFVLN